MEQYIVVSKSIALFAGRYILLCLSGSRKFLPESNPSDSQSEIQQSLYLPYTAQHDQN